MANNEDKINELLTRSIDVIYPSVDELRAKLKSGKKLRVYMGIDPTATYVHLGHATNYIILKRFHDLGHKIIVLIGDFTAMIGDPSDKSSTRIRLDEKQVKENLKTFKAQIGNILNFSDKKNPIELRFNSKWLSKLTFKDSIELASNFTVQRMLERDIFERRIKEEKPLYVHEFFYPLMQGYDSVALGADVEIGGTDQTFNMLAGRTLVKKYQNREKFVICTTLLENPVTGEKLMSKSLGTGIAVNENPKDMYGKVMRLPDEAIVQVFIDCTYQSMEEIKRLKKELINGRNPKEIKELLAYEIVKMYHGSVMAKKEQENFRKVFSDKLMPEDAKEYTFPDGALLSQVVMKVSGASGSEARRLINQGAVSIEGGKITNFKTVIGKEFNSRIIRVGKKAFGKLIIK